MKFLSSFLVGLLITSQVFAGLPPTTLSGIDNTSPPTTFKFRTPVNQSTQVSGIESMIETGSSNILKNPGAEGGTTNWTASAGTFTATTTAGEILADKKAFSWDSNGAAQTVTSDAITIPIGLRGRNAVMSCLFAVQSGTATTTMSVYDGSTSTQTTIITSSATPARTNINFVAASSGTVAIRLASVAADEPKILWDSCYLGPADTYNISQVNQAVLYGSAAYAATTNCDWNSSTPAGTFSADSDCPTPTVVGYASAPGTKIPGITFANGLPPGDYLIIFQGDLWSTRAANNTQSHMSISDGTNRTLSTNISMQATGATAATTHLGNMTGRLLYTTTQAASVTFQPYIEDVNTTVHVDAHLTGLQILVYRFPTSSEIAYRPDLINWTVDAYISGADIDMGTGALSSDTDPANGSLTLTNSARGTISAQIACASGTASSGTTCTAVNEVAGIAFTSPTEAPLAEVCVSGTYGGNGGEIAYLRINKTSNTSSTATTTGTEIKAAGGNVNGSTALFTIPFSICDILPVTTGQNTFRLQYQMDTGTGSGSGNYLYANTKGDNIKWHVRPLIQSVPAPVLVGSVTSGSTGTERVERVQISGAGACAVVAQSGSWVSGVTHNATGDCTLTIASGMFSAAPTCTCTVTNAASRYCAGVGANTSTSIRFATKTYADVAQDQPFDVICVGPR